MGKLHLIFVNIFYSDLKYLVAGQDQVQVKIFIVPRIKTCESGSFFNQGIKNWNELPKHIKEMKGKQSFKEEVKKHLMEKGLDKHNCDFYFY